MTKRVPRALVVAVMLLLGAGFRASATSNKIASPRRAAIQTKQVCVGGASLQGSYGMLVSGSGKFLSGEVSFDGNCNVSGNNITGGVSGQYSTTSVTGTYGENSDGSFTINLNFANPSSAQTYIVGVSESGNKARGIESDNTLEAVIDIQSQLTPLTLGYSTANLSGTYAASCSGVGNTEFDSIGFDGNGNVSGFSSYSNGGGQGSNTLSGTYSVNTDGTFSGSLSGGYSFNGVLDDGVSEIEYTYASGGSGVLACVGKQAAPSPANLLGYYGFVVGETSLSALGGEYYSGSLYFNGSGGVSGSNISGGNGGNYGLDNSVTGSYTVNSNNTISLSLNLSNPTQTYNYVVGVSESGSEASGIETDGAAVTTIDLQNQLQLPGTTYTNASLAGTYSASCQGSEIDLNWTTFDGNGNITAGTDDFDDGAYGSAGYTGSYTVNNDGTFTGYFNGDDYDVYTMTGVLDNGTGEIEFTYDLSGQVPGGGVVGCIGESTFGPIGSNPVLPTPTFSPAPGVFSTAQSVILSDSNASATIYYTTNGTAPSTSSSVYSTPIPVTATTTIQAMAVLSGNNNSAIAASTFFIQSTGLPTAPTPTFSPTPGQYSPSVAVTLSDTLGAAATIYYTTNGTTPNTGSSTYSSPITLTATTTIEAIAVANNYNNSAVSSATYTIPLPTAPSPTFSPNPGGYSAPVAVSLSDSLGSSAAIYYTTNGTLPSTSSFLYSAPITVSASTTINAIAVAPGYSNSAESTGIYTISATGSFALVQHVHNTSCSNTLTCSITLNQNISAGDLLIFESSMYQNSIMIATNNGGTFVPCVSCASEDPTDILEQTSGGWILSAAAQSSSITVTFDVLTSGAVEMWEYSYTGGTPQFDGANEIENESSSTPTATPFTPSGTNDISAQACRADEYCESVTAPFSADNAGSNYYAWADLATPTSWRTPSWTLSGSGISQLTQMEFGFNVTPCANSSFVDFGGASGNAVSVSQLFAGTHGWTGGYWTINGVNADLTYQTAASQTLEAPTGRLCDGGNYTDSSTTGLQYSTANPDTFLQMNGTNAIMTGSTVSAGVWYYSNLPGTSPSQTDDFAIFGTRGHDFVLLHEFGLNGNRYAEIECGSGTSTGNVVLARNTWYWVEIVYNVTGNHTMKIYNNANPPVQVGGTMTCPSVGNVTPGYLTLGNVNTDTSLPAGYLFYFDGLMLSLDGYDPLLPSGSLPTAPAPTFSPLPGSYSPSVAVTLSDSLGAAAAIYYTTNGTTPTTSSSQYISPISVTATTTINAMAVATGYNNSAVISETYTIPLPPTPTPTFSPTPGPYSSVQSVTLSDTNGGAAIYYTTNGTTPTTSSAQYLTPIPVNATTTIEAIAVAAPTYGPSAVASGTYTLTLPAVPTPTFSPLPGNYGAPVAVTLSDTNTGAVIHCTTDGSIPTINSPVCTTLTVSSTATINAIAVQTGYANSSELTGVYTITTAGTFSLNQHVRNTTCSNATTCTITLSKSIGTGDLLVFESSMYPASLMRATNNGGTFVQCLSCAGNDPTSILEQTSGGWILSAAAQSSSITVTFNVATTGVIEMWDYTVTGGTPGFDGANENESQNTASPTATPFTPSGSNDISVQACRANAYCESVTSPFLADNAGSYYSWGYMSSPQNFAAPTWTLAGSAISQLTQMEFGFGVVPCSNTSFVDFGGTNGAAVSVSQLSAGTHGWQGGYWTINGYGADLTYQTAASQTLQQSTGRLCDGGNYTDTSTTGLQYATTNPQTFLQMNGTNGMLPSNSVSVGVWLWSNVPASNGAGTDDVAIFGTGGVGGAQDYMLLHELGYDGARVAEIECGSGTSTGYVTLARNTWYWVELVYNVSGNHTMKIYNNANPPVQIGSTMTCPAKGTEQPAYVTIGNVNTDNALPPGYVFYFDGLLVSLDGIDPLLPSGTSPTAPAPTFSPAPGPYSTAQTVTLSDALVGASIYYTTDGSVPTANSTKFTGSTVQVSATTTINAIATAVGYNSSSVASGIYTITLGTAATPTFTPTPGPYSTVQSVTLADTTTGATIYYTTNGTTPTTSSTKYTAAIPVSATTTIEAIAVATNYNNSAVATGTYTITLPTAATPTFSPTPGPYTGAQTVTLSDTTTGATIYYTTNSTTPTTSSTKYTAAITLTGTTTIEAIAVAPGYTNSAVATGTYTLTATTPTFTPTPGPYTSAQSVTLSDSTTGATIYYTTNGTTPTTSSTKYTAAIPVSATTTIEAIAVAPSYTNSAVATGTYTITLPTAATPTFSPAPGSYSSAQSVTLSDTTTGATIYYTTNGTTPTTSSSPYSSAIPVSATTTIEAIAVAPSYTNSAVATGTYTITLTAATPTFSPTPGAYTSAQSVTLSDSTTGATIYYTTNGTTPTTSSTKYTAAIPVSATTTIEAIAVAANYTNSAVATGTYTITLPTAATPTFSPTPGAYTSVQSVTLSDTTTGATIYYTTNGATPTASSTKYSTAIPVSATTTIEAIAVAPSYTNSAVATGTYTISLPTAATPTFSPAPGTYSSTQSVTLSDATSGAIIYYTTNGTAPTTSSSRYSAAITVSATTTIEAIAVASGYSNSAVVSSTFTIKTGSLTATTTTLTASPNPSVYGQPVLLTAKVSSSSGTPPNGETVTFEQGSTVLGTGTLSGGTATVSVSTLGLGTKAVKAVYAGDANFATSTSAAVSQVINQATSQTTLTSSANPSAAGQSVTFTATVAPEFTGTPTGSVVFKNGTETLATISLSGGSASLTPKALAVGANDITATYNGSPDFAGSTATLTQTVK